MSCRLSNTSTSSSSSMVSGWQHTHSNQRGRQRRSLPELLAIRQATGRAMNSRVGPLEVRGVPLDLVASRSAWNSRRLQNMILAIGPSTPASILMGNGSHPSISSSSSSSEEDQDDQDDEDDQEVATTQRGQSGRAAQDDPTGDVERLEDIPSTTRRSGWLRRNQVDEVGETEQDDQDHDNDDDDDDDDDGDLSLNQHDDQRIEENDDDVNEDNHGVGGGGAIDWDEDDEEEEDSESEQTDDGDVHHHSAPRPVPSIRHGGCINTAAWMDCGWKISLPGGTGRDAVHTEECPTQLVTSGDDLVVKFWDVSQAMGMTSPLSGSQATICPYSAPEPHLEENLIKHKWKRYYQDTHSGAIAGTVLPLATIATGHMNNVFHVTPLRGQPGKVATCAADGFLRLGDLETGHSRVVVSPEFDHYAMRLAMCFSHHFLSQNTGLLCSERGLRRFDLRVSPREQATRSLLLGSIGCKACAIWSASKSRTALEEAESAYVFAGGSAPEVALWDLRMTDAASNKVVQKYLPKNLSHVERKVSVSGIDISKNGQELLVSYESDQIYTFPVFPSSACGARPAMDDIQRLSEGPTKVVPELACYGAHLNRYTFLKNAKYAGPQDEYICTGSDSGHAWIYEKKSGSVVSYLSADHSTCNGVIPHPSLPFFITYGIDSTAKLWRATPPIDATVDDSAMGRWSCCKTQKYEMSAPVEDWNGVQKVLRELDSEEITDFTDFVLPDQIPSSRDINRGSFGLLTLRDTSRRSRLGNDLHNLPRILVQNYFETIEGFMLDNIPVESGAIDLKHRVSLIQLRHQADRLGLSWNPSLPWQFHVADESASHGKEIHPADLVPDYPSDWIPYDPEMTRTPWDFEEYFNTEDHEAFYKEHYASLHVDDPCPNPFFLSSTCDFKSDVVDPVLKSSDNKGSGSDASATWSENVETSRNVITKTVRLLKDGGNLALHEGALDLAAIRYDKALRYSAAASMSFPSATIKLANYSQVCANGDFPFFTWDELSQLAIRTRLNLALLFLMPHFSRPKDAAAQAQNALHDLGPFCTKKGMIMKGRKLTSTRVDNEPEETYLEAKALQAKAYFRLGSAQYELAEFSDAILSYERSVTATEEAKAKPDRLVLRRLAEAKRESRRARKRERTKFEFGFPGLVSPDNNKSGRPNYSDTS